MNFTQPCFIRKNTLELRKKLEKLGYKPFGMVETGFGLSTDELLAEYESFNDFSLENILKVSGTEGYKETIDCGTNEELFLALAALSDDFNENQWFIMDVEVYDHICKGEWFLSTNPQGGKHVGTQIEPLYCHKATVGEIIGHFKTMVEIKDEKIKKIIFDANNKLKNLNFQTHVGRSELAESNFIYAWHNEYVLTLWLDVFDDYEIIMSVTQFFSSSEYRSYVGDLDTIFKKFKKDMEKHFDKHK